MEALYGHFGERGRSRGSGYSRFIAFRRTGKIDKTV